MSCDLVKKHRVMILSDSPIAKTGFGKNCKLLMEYLFKTGKYDLCNVAVGTTDNDLAELERCPWKTYPAVNLQQLTQLKQSNDQRNWESLERMAGYGKFTIDKYIKEWKPSIVFGIQDIWGVDFLLDSTYFKNGLPMVLWTTLDSLPILDSALKASEKMKKGKNFWVWADFARKAMVKLGHENVQTVSGIVNTKNLYKLSNSEKQALRKKFNIDQDAFVLNFVSRNQLRKSIPQILNGFKLFQTNNPQSKAKILLHTNYNEGWPVEFYRKQYDIKNEDILTTYICKKCKNYQIKPYSGDDQNCPYCRSEKTQTQTHPGFGVTEEQLNEIYNLTNVVTNCCTSGGYEISMFEARLVENLSIVTNYSYGELSEEERAFSLPIDWSAYYEPQTNFIKASSSPYSICKQLTKIYNMEETTRAELGRKARKHVLEHCSIEVIGNKIESFIDNTPFISNPEFVPLDSNNDEEWLSKNYYGFIGKEIEKNSQEYISLINL